MANKWMVDDRGGRPSQSSIQCAAMHGPVELTEVRPDIAVIAREHERIISPSGAQREFLSGLA